jgi:serine/threonine-protein kinase
MELDEFKQQWQEMDRKLDRSIALNLRLLTEKRTRRTKLRLVPMLLLQPVQMVIGVALTIFFARFWIANLGTWPLLISGVLLHALSVGLVIDAVVRTALIVRINYAAPVVTIQRYLALMRRWEIRSFKWAWVAVWLAPAPLLIVGAKLLTTVDLWSVAPNVVIYTAIGSIVGVGLSYLFDLWTRHSPRLGAAMNSMYVGYSIAGAQAHLDEIDEFARE